MEDGVCQTRWAIANWAMAAPAVTFNALPTVPMHRGACIALRCATDEYSGRLPAQRQNVSLQGLLEIKNTRRPWEGPMLLGINLP